MSRVVAYLVAFYACVLSLIGVAAALEGSAAGFIAGEGTALLMLVLLLSQPRPWR
jgi:hypothetical protein